MKILIASTLALGLSANAFATYDPLVNEPGFYPEYLTQDQHEATTAISQPEVGSASESVDLFSDNRRSFDNIESKNR